MISRSYPNDLASPILWAMDELIVVLSSVIAALAGLGVVAARAGGRIRSWLHRFERSLKDDSPEHAGHKHS